LKNGYSSYPLIGYCFSRIFENLTKIETRTFFQPFLSLYKSFQMCWNFFFSENIALFVINMNDFPRLNLALTPKSADKFWYQIFYFHRKKKFFGVIWLICRKNRIIMRNLRLRFFVCFIRTIQERVYKLILGWKCEPPFLIVFYPRVKPIHVIWKIYISRGQIFLHQNFFYAKNYFTSK